MPTHCTTDENGNPKVEYVDGASWVDKWSEDEEGHSIYYLNANSFQLNPSDGMPWYMITDWTSGFGHAHFAGEEFSSVAAQYGNFESDASDNFMYATNREEADFDLYQANIDSYVERINNWEKELTTLAMPPGQDGSEYFGHKIEDNLWRPINSTNSGLDGWLEMHSSWVRIKDGATFEAGSTLEGDFQISYVALESNSRIVVKGAFAIESLKEDPWAYPVLENDKRDENSTDFCGGAELGE